MLDNTWCYCTLNQKCVSYFFGIADYFCLSLAYLENVVAYREYYLAWGLFRWIANKMPHLTEPSSNFLSLPQTFIIVLPIFSILNKCNIRQLLFCKLTLIHLWIIGLFYVDVASALRYIFIFTWVEGIVLAVECFKYWL